MLEDLLKWIGAGDTAIATMGPVLTIALAFFFGGAITQLAKFPLSRVINDPWYDWTVRAVALLATAGFAHVLSNAIPWPLEIGAGAAQPLAYKAGLAVIRRYWPWMEASPMIGSVSPPQSAFDAAADRANR